MTGILLLFSEATLEFDIHFQFSQGLQEETGVCPMVFVEASCWWHIFTGAGVYCYIVYEVSIWYAF